MLTGTGRSHAAAVKRTTANAAPRAATGGWLLLAINTPTAYFFFAVTPLSSTRTGQTPTTFVVLLPCFTTLIVIAVSL